MTNDTITRPEWTTNIDPVLQKELEQHILVTTWDKLLGIVDTVYNWGRRSALWPLGFGLACCAIEMICTASSRFDIARFGAEVFRGSPRQADLMIVSGTVTKTMMPMIARLYDQMPEPKYVISMGACATGGGPFKEGYNVVSGIDKFLPVDIYIPGCPPTPQALLNGLIMLQKKIDGEKVPIPLLGKKGFAPWYGDAVERDIPVPVLGPDLIDLRTVEITAERAAMGLLDQHEATLPKPPKIPAPQPEPEPETAAAAPAPAAPAAKTPSKIDMIRAKARGEAPPAAAPTGMGMRPPRNPAGHPPKGRQEGQAGGGPAQPRLARRREAQGPGRPAQCRVRAGYRLDRPGGAIGPDRQARRGRALPPRQEPDQVRLPGELAERPLRGLHRGQLPA